MLENPVNSSYIIDYELVSMLLEICVHETCKKQGGFSATNTHKRFHAFCILKSSKIFLISTYKTKKFQQ